MCSAHHKNIKINVKRCLRYNVQYMKEHYTHRLYCKYKDINIRTLYTFTHIKHIPHRHTERMKDKKNTD